MQIANRLNTKRVNRKKKNRASISVIIPVYNGARYIEEAIVSVINQTVMPLELIIVDDGSTDNSLDIVQSLSTPFPLVIIKQANSGQGAARNHAVTIAKGEFIAPLDQDDKWYPDHLERLLKPFTRNARIGWTYSNVDEINETGQITNFALLNVLPAIHPKRRIVDMLTFDMFILPSASIIRKEAFLAVGGFDPQLKGYEDDDLFLRLFREGYSNIYIGDSLSQWRIYGKSCSFSPSMAHSRRLYAQKLIQSFPDDANLARFWIRDFVIPRFLNNSLGDFVSARAIKDFNKCENALADLCHYAEWARPQTRFKMRIRTLVWGTRLKIGRLLSKPLHSNNSLPTRSLWEGLVTSCFLP